MRSRTNFHQRLKTRRAAASPKVLCAIAIVVALAMGWITTARSQQTPTTAGSSQTPLMERENEIALALSACPPFLRPKATVYVLEKSGYTKVREGQNAFTAIVQHVRPDSQEPQCMDADAGQTFLPRILKVAELRAQGRTQQEIQAFMSDAVKKGTFLPPIRPGLIYMLSDQNFNTNGRGEVFPPHVMFYGTGMTNGDLGVDSKDLGQDGNPKGPIFVAGDGSPFGFIIVPVKMQTETRTGQGQPPHNH